MWLSLLTSSGIRMNRIRAARQALGWTQNDLASRGANVNASVLCPGFVRTHIFDAERNRPEELAAATAGEDEATAGEDEATAMRAAVARGMLDKGKEPAEIADIVFDSITRNRFYILPHPAWDNIIIGRVEQILARQGVATTNMEDVLKRREAGEQF